MSHENNWKEITRIHCKFKIIWLKLINKSVVNFFLNPRLKWLSLLVYNICYPSHQLVFHPPWKNWVFELLQGFSLNQLLYTFSNLIKNFMQKIRSIYFIMKLKKPHPGPILQPFSSENPKSGILKNNFTRSPAIMLLQFHVKNYKNSMHQFIPKLKKLILGPFFVQKSQ